MSSSVESASKSRTLSNSTSSTVKVEKARNMGKPPTIRPFSADHNEGKEDLMATTFADSLDQSFARAVRWNATAKWSTQIVSWASTVVVARLLTPYDYGVVGMVTLFTALAGLVCQYGIGDAVIALRDLTRRQVSELHTISVIMGLVIVGLSCALALPLARFFSAPPVRSILLVLSATFLINAFQTVPAALLRRELRFTLLSSIAMVSAFSQIIATIVFAWLKFRYWSLVLGVLISTLTSFLLISYRKRIKFAFPNIVTLRRELKFARQALTAGVAWYASENADFVTAGRMLGGAALGSYTIAWTVASAPLEKIANLITTITPAFFSALQTDKAELRRYLYQITEIISFVTIPASFGLALTGDYLILVVLGPKWHDAIGPLRLLGVLVAARSVYTILPKVLTAIGDAGFVMWTTISAAIIMPIAFLVGSRWGTNGIATAWIVAFPPLMVPMYNRVFQKTGMRLKEYVSVLMPALSASAIMAAVVLLMRSVMPAGSSQLLCLLLISAIGALSYTASLLVFYPQRVTRMIRVLRNVRQGESPASAVPVQVETN